MTTDLPTAHDELVAGTLGAGAAIAGRVGQLAGDAELAQLEVLARSLHEAAAAVAAVVDPAVLDEHAALAALQTRVAALEKAKRS